MNLALLDPFNAHTPNILELVMNADGGDIGPIHHSAFSPSGIYLATLSIPAPNNTFLLTVWDTLATSIAVIFPSQKLNDGDNATSPPAIAALFWHHNYLFVSLSSAILFVFDPTRGILVERVQMPRLRDIKYSGGAADNQTIHVSSHGEMILWPSAEHIASVFDPHGELQITAAAHYPSGCAERLYLALSSKRLVIYDLAKRKIISPEKETTNNLGGTALGIALHPQERQLSVLLRERIIRVFDLTSDDHSLLHQTPRHRLQDAVNKWPWSSIGYSPNGELIWAVTCQKGKHLVYFWESSRGTLSRVIDGPREEAQLGTWCPGRPALITIGRWGSLYRWVPEYPLQWSALIPHLEEIEENVWYEEREDEFDLPISDALSARHPKDIQDQEDFIDVTASHIEIGHRPALIEQIPLFVYLS